MILTMLIGLALTVVCISQYGSDNWDKENKYAEEHKRVFLAEHRKKIQDLEKEQQATAEKNKQKINELTMTVREFETTASIDALVCRIKDAVDENKRFDRLIKNEKFDMQIAASYSAEQIESAWSRGPAY